LATTAQPGGSTQTYSYTFAKSGPLTLSFGVVDTDSVTGVSLLSIGNLQVAAVPEPESWVMFVAGLGALGWFGRRRARPAA
jgi:hypothetical protein